MDHTSHAQPAAELLASNPTPGLSDFFSQSGFMPHGHCFLWNPTLLGTHVLSDFLIGLAYLGISITLYFLVQRIQIRFSRVILFFGLFIGACGATHFIEIWTLWHPDYWVSGGVKVLTAFASVGTGVYLFRLRHPIYQVAEAAKLSEERKISLEILARELEDRVHERTGQLAASVEQFRTFFELSGFGAAMINPSSMRFLRVNVRFCEMTGYSESELLEKTVMDLTHPEDRKMDLQRFEQAQTASSPQFQSEKRYVRKDGKIIWVLVHGTVVKDGQGLPHYSLATIQDVTEQRATAKAVNESEARFRALANSMSQLAWMADSTGFISWYNQRWYDFTGTTLEEMLGWGWQKVHHPDEIERVTQKWQEHLNRGEFWEDTFPLKGKDGKFRWFLSRAHPIRDAEGQIVQWFGTNTDITDQLRVEQELKLSKEIAENANAAKTQFLANMSHEIRTPIGAIMGFTELLRNPANTEADFASYMTIIERNSQQLLRLIDDILDLSKVEAGKIAIEKINFSLPELLADVISVHQLKASEKGIAFNVQLTTQIPDTVCTDPTRLKQILTNIIGNAIKFTGHGSVSVEIQFNDSLLEFSVSDTGPGILEEQRQRLFQPFEQADPSMTRKYGGTGLGLILSKKLAQALGGDVNLTWSEPRQGSRFLVRIQPTPVRSAQWVGMESLGLDPKLGFKAEERPVLSGMRILLVEDALDNRILITSYLKKTGAQISIAENGLIGTEKALQESPDVILMDIQMPVMDGHRATQFLRSQGFSRPIIAVTAHAMQEEKERCFESGCTDYLTKPVRRTQLIDMLVRYQKRN